MTPDPNDPLSREIDDALDGVNLQELDPSGDDAGPRGGGGDRLWRGVVAGVSGDDVIVELGPRMQGVVALTEFDQPPTVGDVHRFVLRGREDDLWILSMRDAQELAAWDEVQVGSLVRARVSGQNQGGLELKIGKNDAFMPLSQVGLGRDEDVSTLLGKTLTCEVLEIDRGRKRCLVSHRRVQEREKLEALQQSLGKLHPGMVLSGKVTRVEPFGAFVDLGNGIEGLVHVSNLSRQRVENAAEFVQKGQEVQVQVLEIKEGGKRIGLGMKQLEPDPWDGLQARLHPDAVVEGKVTRLTDFGAFVELEPGIEGLLHVSRMSTERVRRPGDLAKVGSTLPVRIESIDGAQRRISLSRLDARGAMIGSEDSVETELIDNALAKPTDTGLSTNLGDLFRKALQNKKA